MLLLWFFSYDVAIKSFDVLLILIISSVTFPFFLDVLWNISYFLRVLHLVLWYLPFYLLFFWSGNFPYPSLTMPLLVQSSTPSVLKCFLSLLLDNFLPFVSSLPSLHKVKFPSWCFIVCSSLYSTCGRFSRQHSPSAHIRVKYFHFFYRMLDFKLPVISRVPGLVTEGPGIQIF